MNGKGTTEQQRYMKNQNLKIKQNKVREKRNPSNGVLCEIWNSKTIRNKKQKGKQRNKEKEKLKFRLELSSNLGIK